MTDYRLTCTNSSTLHGNFAIYQVPPLTENSAQIIGLAWMARPAAPGTRLAFSWDTQMSFVWGERGVYRSRSYFNACQQVLANPERENLIDLTSDAFGAPTFLNLRTGGPLGTLTIRQLSAIFDYPVHLGVAISGAPVYTVNFNANISTAFIPHPNRYWVVFGGYTAGDTIDSASVTNSLMLEFSPTTPSQGVIMGPDNILRPAPAMPLL